MKQSFLLVLCFVMLSFVEAQSQTITGTLLPKSGKPIVVSPTGITGLDSAAANNKTVANGKFFIFNKPVVQGQGNGQTTAQANNQSAFSGSTAATVDAKRPTVQLSSTPGQTLPIEPRYTPANEPLKYEEPPVPGSASSTASNNASTNANNLTPLVYGPPPSATDGNSAATVTTPTSNLKSPKIQGTYKAELKQPIVLVPLSPENIESNNPKVATTNQVVTQSKPAQPVKSIEDLYPPLNYGPPPSTVSSNLRSPKIQGTYVATKNNPYILMPVPPDTTAPISTQDAANNSPINTGQQSTSTGQPRTEVLSDNSSINNKFQAGTDFISNQTTSKTKLQGPVKQSVDDPSASTFKAGTDFVPDETTASTSTFKAGTDFTPSTAYTSKSKKTSKKLTGKKPKYAVPTTAKTYPINKFQAPVKQTTDNTYNNPAPATVINTVPSSNTTNPTADKAVVDDQPSQVNSNARADYKFYLTPNGKYSIVFGGYGSSVSVTSFGRVSDYTLPSTGGITKPVYNYKGLIESVGDLPLQYTYEGRIASVGATAIGYNYDGAINKVGNTTIIYNYNGTVDRIGASKVTYDENGNITNMDKSPMILVKQ